MRGSRGSGVALLSSPGAGYLLGALRGRRLGVALLLALTLLRVLGEGAGLLLLVPLLRLVGVDGAGGDGGPLEGGVLAAFRDLGIPPTLSAVLALFVLLVSAGALLERARAVAGAALQARLVADLRKRLYRALTRMEWVHFTRTPPSESSHALTEGVEDAGVALQIALDLAAASLLLGTYLAVSLAVAPETTLLSAALGGALLLALGPWLRRGSESGAESSRARRAVHRAAREYLGGSKVARSHGWEEDARVRFEGLADRVAAAREGMLRGLADARVLFAIASAACLGVVVLVARGGMGLGPAAVLLLLFVFSRISPRLAQVQQAVHSLATLEPAVSAVAVLQRTCDGTAEPADPAAPVALGRSVRLEGVTFSYGGDGGAPAVRGVDLELRAGEMTAVVGPSGAGKTTLADLVTGLLVPTAGRVLLDGVPLTAARRAGWRARIACVLQDPFLFDETLRANLLVARPGATEEEIRRALSLADASALVDRLPGGLDARVGERGGALSGGERQRIALARALLREPDLLVLDEATSHLDPESERRVRRAVAGLRGRTAVLLVTHRLAPVREADRIHVLEAGRIVESGTWEKLMGAGRSRLRDMALAQGGGIAARPRTRVPRDLSGCRWQPDPGGEARAATRLGPGTGAAGGAGFAPLQAAG